MPKVGPRSRFVTPPAADGSIHTETLGWPEVVALTSTTSLVRIEGKTVAAERIVFVYDPGRTTLAAQLPEGSRYLGQVRRRLFAASRSGRPVELCRYLPVYPLPASHGSRPARNRQRLVQGQGLSVRVDLSDPRHIKNKKQ